MKPEEKLSIINDEIKDIWIKCISVNGLLSGVLKNNTDENADIILKTMKSELSDISDRCYKILEYQKGE